MFKITLLSGAALVVLALPAMAAETAAPAAAANANAPKAPVAAPAAAPAPAVTAPAGMPAAAAEKPLRWDDNGDGAISKDEWLKHQTEKFDEIDANKDGKVTREEMKTHGEAMRQKMMEMHSKMAPAGAAPAAPAAAPKK